jgi:hypothetical protein
MSAQKDENELEEIKTDLKDSKYFDDRRSQS